MRCLPLMLLAAACEPLGSGLPDAAPGPGGGGGAGTLVLTPARVDFGAVSVTSQGSLELGFAITNAGDETLTVYGHNEVVPIEPPDAVVFTVPGEGPILQLEPGASLSLPLRFTPPTEGAWTGQLRVNGGEDWIDLSGEGRAPVVALSAPRAPSTPMGCTSEVLVSVDNPGSEPLHLVAAQLEGAADFGPAPLVSDLEVPAGGYLALGLPFAPPWTAAGGGERQARLRLWTDDPYRPESSVELVGLAYEGEAVVERFVYAPASMTDLLLVSDPGGVMDAYLGLASGALGGLVDGLVEANVDLHAAALSAGGDCPVWSDAADPAALTARLQAGLAGPTADERLLIDVAARTLAQSAPGDCLEGFLRPGALLSILFIAGGPDEAERSAAESLGLLRAAAPEALDLRVSAVIPTEASGCAGLTYGAGYAELALATGGVLADLCAGDWGGTYGALAAQSAAVGAGDWRWPLAERPLVDSLWVTVDGAPFGDWRYDEAENALIFDGLDTPDPGAEVELRYSTVVPCP